MSNYNTQLQSNNTDLQEVLQTLQTKAAGGEQATPVISVGSNGLITATAGTKSSTHQLAFQPAKTVTPSTVSQVAVSSGYYTGGNVTVTGDANLVAENIKAGVSVFGVIGAYEGSNSGDTSMEDGLITRAISNYSNNRVTIIGSQAFVNCSSLVTINCPNATIISNQVFVSCIRLISASFPAVTSIGSYAFQNCTRLTTANFPALTSVDQTVFANCTNLVTISFPKLVSINTSTFHSCKSLTTASFPAARFIGSSAFRHCYSLNSLYLTGSSLCGLGHSNAFSSTPIDGYGTYGFIYVPTSLLTSYQTATNWAYFSSRFVAYDGKTNLITFTINEASYQAESGMTWEEWCNSEYNTTGWYNSNGKIVNSAGSELSEVTSSDIINNGAIYVIDTSGWE